MIAPVRRRRRHAAECPDGPRDRRADGRDKLCAEHRESTAPGALRKAQYTGEAAGLLPGIGELYVNPKTLPERPFLAYDHQGKLVSTIYMVPLKDLNAHKTFADLPAPGGRVDHVSLYYNAGHPGVPEPPTTSCSGTCRRHRRSSSRSGDDADAAVVVGVGGGLLVSALPPPAIRADAPGALFEIHMKSGPSGAVVGFDPVGALLQPGQTVRWICAANVHTTTAYSPKNHNHSLRIPQGAQPRASDFLLPGQSFEVKLTVEGVYDYFCMPPSHRR
ncbi:MAG TPA: DUF5602 domain-containing protein [Stellaceae bacterium]|nr:DUF5602 domain-containing protein [Stellaceae bacterium]